MTRVAPPTRNKAQEILVMPSRIIKKKTSNDALIECTEYASERIGQELFDEVTKYGSEYDGDLQVDLDVKHPELGWITRRTMFI